jgi:hypothetical protein
MKGRMSVWRAVALYTIALAVGGSVPARAEDQINSVKDLVRAFGSCWVAAPRGTRSGIAFSARMSFRGNGELLGRSFVFFQTQNVSEEERQTYRAAVEEALKWCTPFPFSSQFGSAIAGHPITLHITQGGGPKISI